MMHTYSYRDSRPQSQIPLGRLTSAEARRSLVAPGCRRRLHSAVFSRRGTVTERKDGRPVLPPEYRVGRN